MNHKETDNQFTWGDPVIISKDAPNCFHPNEFASICAIDKIVSEEEANDLHCQIGEWIYLVEFEDGSDLEIPECYLEKYQAPTQNNS